MPDIFVAKDAKKERKRPTVSIQDSESRQKDPAAKKPKKATVTYPKTHKEKEKLPGHTSNPLTSFSYYPDHAKFITQDPEERVILLLRRHPITNLRWIIIAAIFVMAPLFLAAFPIVDFLPIRFQIIVVISWYLLTLAFIFEEFLSWFFHVNIITDERIIEVDFVNLIYREITDANIDQIQDVTVQMGGVIRTVLNYGDVVVQTAAQIPQIEFEAVPNPDRVSRILRELRVEEEQEKLEGRVR